MANIVHVGDTKIIFRILVKDDGVIRDISSASAMVVLLENGATGVTVAYTGTFPSGEDGTQGQFEYAAATSSILPVGSDAEWRIQGKVTYADGTVFHTEKSTFDLLAVLTP